MPIHRVSIAERVLTCRKGLVMKVLKQIKHLKNLFFLKISSTLKPLFVFLGNLEGFLIAGTKVFWSMSIKRGFLFLENFSIVWGDTFSFSIGSIFCRKISAKSFGQNFHPRIISRNYFMLVLLDCEWTCIDGIGLIMILCVLAQAKIVVSRFSNYRIRLTNKYANPDSFYKQDYWIFQARRKTFKSNVPPWIVSPFLKKLSS